MLTCLRLFAEAVKEIAIHMAITALYELPQSCDTHRLANGHPIATVSDSFPESYRINHQPAEATVAPMANHMAWRAARIMPSGRTAASRKPHFVRASFGHDLE